MTAEDATEGRTGDEEAHALDGPADGGGEDGPERADCHLADVEVGTGCTKIWEHLGEHRRERDRDG